MSGSMLYCTSAGGSERSKETWEMHISSLNGMHKGNATLQWLMINQLKTIQDNIQSSEKF